MLDQAGWHTSDQVVPEGIELVPLPSHSPELQPAERLWPLTNEPLVNRSFASLEELDQVLGERCVTLSAMPEMVRSLTTCHWWPADAEGSSWIRSWYKMAKVESEFGRSPASSRPSVRQLHS